MIRRGDHPGYGTHVHAARRTAHAGGQLEEPLADAMRSGRIGAFTMDSDDERLHASDSPLRELPHLQITPRLAPFTQESQVRGSWYLVDRIHETLMLAEIRSQTGPLDSEPMPLA